MDSKMVLQTLLITALVSTITCVYEEPQYKQQYLREPLYKQPQPRILSHHQSQTHDGGFKFAYTAENGLAQTEHIAPDGTRNGGYQYVDPHGKTITVKYTAGKDGFRIVEGDHIPREVHASQNAPSNEPRNDNDDGSYNADRYEKPEQQLFTPQYIQPKQYAQQPPKHYEQQLQAYQAPKTQYRQIYIAPPQYSAPQPKQYANQYTQDTSASNSVENTEYHQAAGKAHSFGTGYSFQFSN